MSDLTRNGKSNGNSHQTNKREVKKIKKGEKNGCPISKKLKKTLFDLRKTQDLAVKA